MKIIKIGKASNNDIVISGDSTVSRSHMQMFIDEEANVFVTDLSSLNGTFINGVKISDSVKLNTFDIVKVGNSLINWKEYLLDDVDAQDAYKTIVDDDKQDLLDSLDDIDSNQIKRSKKKKSYIWYIAAACIVFGGMYMYFNTDKQLILDKWVLKTDNNLSFTFNDDGTFIKDSAGIVKEGTYKLIDGRNKKLELSFDKASLPVFEKELKIFSTPNNGWGNIDERVLDEYYGNTFNIVNKSEHPLKIISTTTTSFKNKNETNVKTLVYTINSDYSRNINSNDEVDIRDWELLANISNAIINGKFTSLILLKDCVIPSKSVMGMMLISNISATYVNGSGSPGISVAGSDNFMEVSEGHATAQFDNDFLLNHKPRNWNGDIIYGIMQSDFDYSYEFVDGYLEINGKLFTNN